MSGGEVGEGGRLLALGNILGLGESVVLLLGAGLGVGDHLGPVDDHVLGQFPDLVDVLADAVDGLFLDLPVGDAVIGTLNKVIEYLVALVHSFTRKQ